MVLINLVLLGGGVLTGLVIMLSFSSRMANSSEVERLEAEVKDREERKRRDDQEFVKLWGQKERLERLINKR